MLYTFKSATIADLIMHEKNGKEILALLGKSPEDARGIITVEQLPGAIAKLHQTLVAGNPRTQEAGVRQNQADTDEEPAVSLSQRAAPFIDMLERALKAGEPVVWGV